MFIKSLPSVGFAFSLQNRLIRLNKPYAFFSKNKEFIQDICFLLTEVQDKLFPQMIKWSVANCPISVMKTRSEGGGNHIINYFN